MSKLIGLPDKGFLLQQDGTNKPNMHHMVLWVLPVRKA